MDTNKKYIKKLNKLTEEMCRFYDISSFLSGEYIEKYDSILRVLNFEKMGINRKVQWNVTTLFEREIDFLKAEGFNKLIPFHSVICQIKYGKSYTEQYTGTIQKNLKEINTVITTIRIHHQVHKNIKDNKINNIWNSRPVHK